MFLLHRGTAYRLKVAVALRFDLLQTQRTYLLSLICFIFYYLILIPVLYFQLTCSFTHHFFVFCFTTLLRDGGGRSGTVGGMSPGFFFWVLPKRSIPKLDLHRKDIFSDSL